MSRRLYPRVPGHLLVLCGVVLLTALLVPASGLADEAGGGAGDEPVVTTASDDDKEKLHPKLEEKVESGSNEKLYVFVTVAGSSAEVKGLLDDDAEAKADPASIVVGSLRAQQLLKLASLKNVVSVGPVDLRKTGQPLGIGDPELGNAPSVSARKEAVRELRRREVPFDRAPRLKGSNFEAMKKLDVLDGRTHSFTGAWNAGFTGQGVTVGVLDGGTDFGHPDLIGTWQTWSGAPDPGWNGWPKAFDPYGTLVLLAAPPDFVELGLTWYATTTEKTCELVGRKQDQCKVTFATRTGPARNFAAPPGTVAHEYTYPAGFSKSGKVRLGSHPDDHLLLIYGERPAFLVVDQATAGVYDTVYVDLDSDFDFGDEKPVNKASPVAYRDMNGDGYTDLSGGLVYYISDGQTTIPGGPTSFGIADKPAPGAFLAWSGDFDPAIGGHGTLTASNVVAQAVINGKAPCFTDLRSSAGAVRCRGDAEGTDTDGKGGTYPGVVLGGAPNAKLAPFGDIYFSFDFSTQFAYFLTTRRAVDVTTNSYGSSNVDNDGYDAASQEADIWHDGRRTTWLGSTGNGAPGFGTTAPPSPVAGISVGASTQFGATGWDSVSRYSQVVDNDVMVWSNRGPGATGAPGVDVVADGAFSAGDVTLNAILDGRYAWTTWGGTSRSAPVAGAAVALVYEAYKQAHGGAVPARFYEKAKEILKSSADDLGYDSYTQGAGSVNADKAVRSALGTRGSVAPTEWRVGDYRGQEWPVFTHVIAPGGSDSQTFTLSGSDTWQVSDRQLRRTASQNLSFTSSPVANESEYNFNAPDYLIDITSHVEAHPDAELMVIRANFPRSQFDADANYEEDQAWRVVPYNWTDVNGDRNLWEDQDSDGVADHVLKDRSSNIDGFQDIGFGQSEIDRGEYVRFMYHRAGSNALMGFVRNPAQRMADGLFLGLQHSARSDAIPTTSFQIQIDWYDTADWSWVSTPASATGSLTASIAVPGDTPYGMYDGAIVLSNGTDRMVVPVSVAVAAQVPQDADGKIVGSLTLGGEAVAEAQEDLLYNNGSVFGASDWTWRAESGDWRFYFLDVAREPPAGTLFLTDTTWQDSAPFTDLDTLVFGRSENFYQLVGPGPFGAPYILDTVGKSANTNVGAGVWVFDTATGGAEEVVAATAQEGLHAIVQHQVGWDGGKFHVPFETNVGSASVSPAEVNLTTAADSGSFDVTFESSIDLAGLEAEAFGLSQPVTTTETAQQDDPSDPSSASVKKNVTVAHASRAVFETHLDQDIDLFVVFDANNDGTFELSEIVGASAGATGDERVEITRPEDGNYQVWVQGFAIGGSPTFPLTIDVVQGNDMSVSGLPAGPVAAGTPVTLTVAFSKAMTSGQTYKGELLLGPPSAPFALSVPIAITKS